MNKTWFDKYLKHHTETIAKMDFGGFEAVMDRLLEALKKNQKIFVIGNGGSAANASHFAEDLGKGASDALTESHFVQATQPFSHLVKELKDLPRFRVYSLTDSVPYITALGNDNGFENIYVRQLMSLADPNDVLIGISVSGTSPNLVEAFKWGAVHGLYNISLTGKKGKEMRTDSIYALSNLGIVIPSEHYGVVEDCEMTFLHMLCYYVMETLK